MLDRLRDRLVTQPKFRAWAARFPLTRPIARRRTQALFDMCAGFVYAQTLAACVELDVFERLAAGPVPLPTLAGDIPLPAFRALVTAAVGLRLLVLRAEAVGLGPLGAAMVGNAGLVAMVRHHGLLYADLADPVALLRAGRGSLGDYWAYAGAGQPGSLAGQPVAAYSELMAASQPLVAAEILDAYPLGRAHHVLDVGGGEGAFLRAAVQRVPGLRGTLFDLPAVIARAQFDAHGPLVAVGGDIFRDALPTGADVATLVRVIHDHNDDRAMAILRAVRGALGPGGTVMLAEPMAETAGAASVGAYFSLYLLAMGSGRPRSRATLTVMLHAAGFRNVRARATSTPLLIRVLTAEV